MRPHPQCCDVGGSTYTTRSGHRGFQCGRCGMRYHSTGGRSWLPAIYAHDAFPSKSEASDAGQSRPRPRTVGMVGPEQMPGDLLDRLARLFSRRPT